MGDTMSQETTKLDESSLDKSLETLSALLDGEVSELEARRVLRDMTDEDGARLARWQLASDLMQGHEAAAVPKDFNANLMAALENERSGKPAWMHPIASLAVAASVAVATVIGWQYWEYTSVLDHPAVVSSDSRLPRLLGGDTELVSQSLRPQALPAAVQAEQARRDAMMAQHSELAARHSGQGVMASARFVSQEADALDVSQEDSATADASISEKEIKGEQ